jgi:hypothetical protein
VIFVLHLLTLLVLLDSSFGTTSSSLWIHYSCESPNLVEDHKKVCITRSFEQILVCGLDLCGRQRDD